MPEQPEAQRVPPAFTFRPPGSFRRVTDASLLMASTRTLPNCAALCSKVFLTRVQQVVTAIGEDDALAGHAPGRCARRKFLARQHLGLPVPEVNSWWMLAASTATAPTCPTETPAAALAICVAALISGARAARHSVSTAIAVSPAPVTIEHFAATGRHGLYVPHPPERSAFHAHSTSRPSKTVRRPRSTAGRRRQSPPGRRDPGWYR